MVHPNEAQPQGEPRGEIALVCRAGPCTFRLRPIPPAMTILTRALALLALSVTTAFAQTKPTVSVQSATPGANGAATLAANVTTNGAVTTVTFSYGLTTNYTNTATVSVPDAAGVQVVPAVLANLIGNQTYHFQISAVNSAGTGIPTADQTFVELPYQVKPTTGVATTVAGTATLRGTVTANGTAGKAHFEYGLTNAYGSVTSDVVVGANSINQPIQASVPGLTRNMTYHFRLVFVDDATLTPANGADAQFVTNNAPVARTDTINAAGTGPTTINPLVNDTDVDVDPRTLVGVATQPQHGKAVVSGSSIIYTPDAGSAQGFDTFTYTIKDSFGLTATGTISIRAVRGAFAGTHGGFIKQANGQEVGYFHVTATSFGTFTGIAIIDGKRYVVSGTISADGVYRGFAREGNSAISVLLLTDQNDNGSLVTALFDNGRWASELSLSPSDRTSRPQLMGRYTAGLAAGGAGPGNGNDAGTPPAGSGWLAIRVSDDANASIKGRLSDGRSFSTRGTVNFEGDVATLTFYDDPEGTRLVGNLTLSDAVGGTVRTDRHTSGEGLYPRGYDITQGADGARYLQPVDGKRILDTDTSKGQDLTISFSGGGLGGTLTRDLVLDDRDKVKVLNSSAEDLKVRIDRKSGRFQAKVTIDTAGTRIKATGVLIQATSGGTGGRGTGTFDTNKGSGTVSISAGGSGGTTTPAPNPVAP